MSRHDCRRCSWSPERGEDRPGPLSQLADHAADSGHSLCIVCGWSLGATELQSCVECLADVRRLLSAIVDLFALLPGTLGHARGARYDVDGPSGGGERPMPGGDALVMLAGGSAGAQWRGRVRSSRLGGTQWRAPRSLRRDPTPDEGAPLGRWVEAEPNDNLEGDAPSVAFELGSWEDDWRSVRGEPAADGEASVVAAVAYLSARAGWAADYHRAFDEFATDVRRLHSRLEVATAMDARPAIGAPCFEEGCGADLRREWTDQGLADVWRCPRCRREYDEASYWLAVRASLEAQRGVAG